MRDVINISLSKELNRELEVLVKKGKYSTKSEFLREMIRQRIAEEDLLRRIQKSEADFKAGKFKVLKSLKDLR